MRCDLVQDALVPPGQRARVRTTPPGLSGMRTGGRRRMGSALIRRCVTTSELGLRRIPGSSVPGSRPRRLGFLSWNPDISLNFLLLAQQTCDGDWSTSFRLCGRTPKRGHSTPPPPEAQEPCGRERGWHLSPMAFHNCPGGAHRPAQSPAASHASEVCRLLSGLPQAAQPPGLAWWQTG